MSSRGTKRNSTAAKATPPAKAAKKAAASPAASSASKVNGAADKSKKMTPKDYFDTLEYGPAPESPAAFNAWLDSHDRKFGCFIDNKWVHHADKKNGKYRDSICPATKTVMAQTMEGTEKEVELAVTAARRAYPAWTALKPHERAKHLYAIARQIAKHARVMSVCESLDNGKSFRETKSADIPLVIRHFYHHAGWAQLMDTEMADWKSVGVICEIVPWNFPLMLLAWKVCPALAMGNTIVLKPASVTRLSALLFAQICAEAGLPPGVFNIVTGTGRIGSAIADHPQVDKVAFTGSTPVGQLLRTRIAGSGKKISLELGGKSPVIVFPTADLDSVVEGIVNAIYFNQGQVCSAGSRLIVHDSVANKVVEKLKQRINHFRIGHPLEKNIDMGALVDQSQYDTIKGFCERAEASGADVFYAQVPVPTFEEGYFWPPTIVSNVHPVSECVREEIFGPVLAVQTFRTPEEAIKLANNTKFGLAGSIWTENVSLAMEMALCVKAGAMWVNCHNVFDAAAGFGGYRESGFGRDGGKEGLYEYVKPKWEPRTRPELVFPCVKADWQTAVPGVPASCEESALSDVSGPFGSVNINRTPKLFIGGKQCRPDGQYSRKVMSPTGGVVGHVSEGNRKDIRNAVQAAHKAAPGWGKRAAHNRAQIMYYIAENLTIRAAEFAARIAAMTGRSHESGLAEVSKSVERLFHYAALADKYGGVVQETSFYGLTARIHEPVGVIGIACPEDFPLLGFISCIAPAIVRANTVVVLPSQTAGLSATDLYQVLETSDLPAGVLNIVTGERDVLCKTLAEHDDVQCMWYFGSAQGSRNIEYAAAQNMKRTWVNYGHQRDWMDDEQARGEEFLLRATECKNVWVPIGEMK